MKPNIQIDDLVREMTDEEFANYQAFQEAYSAEMSGQPETTEL